jgi:hypothetical protein
VQLVNQPAKNFGILVAGPDANIWGLEARETALPDRRPKLTITFIRGSRSGAGSGASEFKEAKMRHLGLSLLFAVAAAAEAMAQAGGPSSRRTTSTTPVKERSPRRRA